MNRFARGFTLIEMMVSITIGLFLIGGMLTLIQTMKSTSGTQGGLSQLQDDQRLALRVMTDVIQATGDYNNQTTSTAIFQFPALTLGPVVFAPGQSVWGSGAANAAAPGDKIAVRYQTAGNDGITNCIGGISAVPATFVNVFSIDVNSNLQCQMTTIVGGAVGATVTATLVGNISNLWVRYGMKTNFNLTNTAVDAYLDATQIAALPNPPITPPNNNSWLYIKSVQIILTFANPLAGQPAQPATIPLMRVVNIMNQVGGA